VLHQGNLPEAPERYDRGAWLIDEHASTAIKSTNAATNGRPFRCYVVAQTLKTTQAELMHAIFPHPGGRFTSDDVVGGRGP
jgi:hypothetical protein